MDNTKQHYVPRFILRKFAVDSGEKFIHQFSLKSEVFRRSIPLYSQCQKDNFYGADKRIEKLFTELETEVSRYVNIFISDPSQIIKMKKEVGLSIHEFMITQWMRTVGAIEDVEDMINTFAKAIIQADKSAPEGIENVRLSLTNPISFVLSQVLELIKVSVDLKIALVECENVKFLLSDNPVFLINPFVKMKDDLLGSGCGIGCVGAILVMPVTPNYLLCLYDSDVYGLEKVYYHKISDHDGHRINSLSIFRAVHNIYFNNDITSDYVVNLFQKPGLKESREAERQKVSELKDVFVNGKKIPKKDLLINIRREDLKFDDKIRSIPVKSYASRAKFVNSYDLRRPYVKHLTRMEKG